MPLARSLLALALALAAAPCSTAPSSACNSIILGDEYLDNSAHLIEKSFRVYNETMLIANKNLCHDGLDLKSIKFDACTVEGTWLTAPVLKPKEIQNPLTPVLLKCFCWPGAGSSCPEGVDVTVTQYCASGHKFQNKNSVYKKKSSGSGNYYHLRKLFRGI